MGMFRRMIARFSPLLLGRYHRRADGRCQTGELGERVAACYLEAMGCRVLWRNFRGPHGGEVDLVVRDGVTLVFAEVKTRSSLQFGSPAEAVTLGKRKLIERGAQNWLSGLAVEMPVIVRFDVVEVLLSEGERPEVNWIRGAFEGV